MIPQGPTRCRLHRGQIARREGFIEVCEHELQRSGLTSGRKMKALADLMLRAMRRQVEMLNRCGFTPRARAEWVRSLARGGLAAEIAPRRENNGVAR